MSLGIKILCEAVQNMVYDDYDAESKHGFDFFAHSRTVGLFDLTESEELLSNAYVTALKKQQDFFQDVIREKNLILKDVASKVVDFDAIHIENIRRYTDGAKQEESIVEGIVETIVNDAVKAMDRKSLGLYIKGERVKKGLSQVDLSVETGLGNPQRIAALEGGRIKQLDLWWLAKVCQILDINFVEIVAGIVSGMGE